MSIEKPRVEKSEKEARIRDVEKQVDEVRDALDKPIDPGIKKAVVALNLFGFPTRQSCEGHSEDYEEENESRTPWINIEVSEPENFKDNKEVQEKWTKENLEKQTKIIEILDEFYQDRQVSFDTGLHLKPAGVYGAFTLESQGSRVTKALTKEEQDEKRKVYQNEMNDFAEFLRNKFLKKNSW